MNRSFRLGKLNILTCFAIVLALAAVLLLSGRSSDVTKATAATTGGIGTTKPTANPPAAKGKSVVRGARFGTRVLRQGMAGADVKVLKSIVRHKRLLSGRLNNTFDRPTTSAVRRFQRSARIKRSGVVNRGTARAMVRSLHTSVSTWYGPGLYGNMTACGKVRLGPKTIGVAHKRLPCGSRVLIGFRGRYVIVPVIDRGPFGHGRTWDLTAAAARSIGLTNAGVGRVRHAVISRGN